MEIYGLFGEKLSHSMSPEIFNILFKKYNIKGTYSLFEIKKENFKNSINAVKTLNIKGINVTIPYKISVLDLIDEIDESALKIGACNCIRVNNGIAKGFNTDYYGVLDALKYNKVDVKNKKCIVLGSGGASKSVITLLEDLGALSIKVVQRIKNIENKGIVEYIDYEELKNIESSYLLVNTTPVGMSPNIENSPISKIILQKFEVCFDAVYNPVETKLLKEAKTLNIKTIDGLYMLVGQAINAFTIFNGIEVLEDDFINIYREVLQLLTKKI